MLQGLDDGKHWGKGVEDGWSMMGKMDWKWLVGCFEIFWNDAWSHAVDVVLIVIESVDVVYIR